MTDQDLEQLEKLATAAQDAVGPYKRAEARGAFHTAAAPKAVLELVAEVRRLREELADMLGERRARRD